MVTGTGSVAQGAPVTTNNIKNDMSVDSTLPPRRTSDNRRVSITHTPYIPTPKKHKFPYITKK